MPTEAFVALVACLGILGSAGISALVTYLLGHRKSSAEAELFKAQAAEAMAGAAEDIIGGLRFEVTRLQDQVTYQGTEIQGLKTALRCAEKRIAELEAENTHLKNELRKRTNKDTGTTERLLRDARRRVGK